MTLLLASVANADEAQIALVHGADIIDLKDVSRGALVGLPAAEVRAVVRVVAGRRPVSAVAGDTTTEPDGVAAAVADIADTGVDYIKIGLFPAARSRECVRAMASLARRVKLVGVMFADMEVDDGLVTDLAECGFAGAMLDTAHKSSGRLLDHMDVAALNRFVMLCRANRLTSGLAGSLEPPDIPRLLMMAPEFLGFRGALCGGHGRAGALDPESICLVRDLIPADPHGNLRPGRPPPADARILAARGYGPAANTESATDRVFVHDLVMPVRIGAYSRERREPQNVRFNIDVEVARSGRAADLRDVFSYDLIVDGIRIIIGEGHISLVEVLAERVAAFILAHPLVVRATVRVEKLDLGAGAVGIEIRRERAAEVAQVHQLFPTVRAAE
jgi:(5-formylfuran-3-yl)methyl phosphate synthase